MLMALVEEYTYNQYLELTLTFGYDEPRAHRVARKETEYFIEGLYFQEFPYIKGDFPHIKEDE